MKQFLDIPTLILFASRQIIVIHLSARRMSMLVNLFIFLNNLHSMATLQGDCGWLWFSLNPNQKVKEHHGDKDRCNVKNCLSPPPHLDSLSPAEWSIHCCLECVQVKILNGLELMKGMPVIWRWHLNYSLVSPFKWWLSLWSLSQTELQHAWINTRQSTSQISQSWAGTEADVYWPTIITFLPPSASQRVILRYLTGALLTG